MNIHAWLVKTIDCAIKQSYDFMGILVSFLLSILKGKYI